MSDPIDLSAVRNQRTAPDAEFVKRDDFGRQMQVYLIQYTMDGEDWGGVQVWAYSMDDAQRRVQALRASATLLGQAMRSGRV